MTGRINWYIAEAIGKFLVETYPHYTQNESVESVGLAGSSVECKENRFTHSRKIKD
jgi:hypothetical protein